MQATTPESSFQRYKGKSAPILHIMKYFSTLEMTGVKKRRKQGARRCRFFSLDRQEIKEMNIERRIQSQGGFNDSRGQVKSTQLIEPIKPTKRSFPYRLSPIAHSLSAYCLPPIPASPHQTPPDSPQPRAEGVQDQIQEGGMPCRDPRLGEFDAKAEQQAKSHGE